MSADERRRVSPEVWADDESFSVGLRLGALVAGAIAASLGLLALAAGVFGRS